MKLKSLISATVMFAAVQGAAHATTITIDFTSLPSTQGWTYFTDGGATETDVFSVAGGVLSMNGTLANAAYYKIEGAVDPALPFSLTARARVMSGGQALSFDVATDALFAGINISPTTIIDETNGAFLASLDNTMFHDYRIEGAFGTGYQLFVDNTLLATGSFGAYPVNMLVFGDGGSFGGGHAEITTFSFQQTAPIPEPATPLLLMLGLGVMFLRLGSRVKRIKGATVDFPKSRYWRDGKGGTTDYGF